MPSMLEVFAVVTGIATVALAARGHIANWPIGIVSSAVFLVVFLEAGLYADALLQGLYVVLGAYGWWAWLYDGPKRTELRVTFAPNRLRLALASVAVVGTLGFGAFLDATTDSTVPYPDAATTVLDLSPSCCSRASTSTTGRSGSSGVNVPYIALLPVQGPGPDRGAPARVHRAIVMGWRAWLRASREQPGTRGAVTPAGTMSLPGDYGTRAREVPAAARWARVPRGTRARAGRRGHRPGARASRWSRSPSTCATAGSRSCCPGRRSARASRTIRSITRTRRCTSCGRRRSASASAARRSTSW